MELSTATESDLGRLTPPAPARAPRRTSVTDVKKETRLFSKTRVCLPSTRPVVLNDVWVRDKGHPKLETPPTRIGDTTNPGAALPSLRLQMPVASARAGVPAGDVGEVSFYATRCWLPGGFRAELGPEAA